jgi:hypothetical protein
MSDFVQCDVCWSDAYKNQTDGLAKSVGQQKLDRFWLFHVNNPLVADVEKDFFLNQHHLICFMSMVPDK